MLFKTTAFALFQLAQVLQPLGKLAQLRNRPSPPVASFAVTGDKRHGRTVVQKVDGGGDLGGGGGEFLREDLGDVHEERSSEKVIIISMEEEGGGGV